MWMPTGMCPVAFSTTSKKGLGPQWKWLAVLYAFLAGLAAFGIGNMVQSNTMAQALETGFGIPHWATGFALVILVGVVTLGGISRIAVTAEKVVPIMAVAYVIGAIAILAMNASAIPGALSMIITSAFSPAPAVGGFAGASVGDGDSLRHRARHLFQ